MRRRAPDDAEPVGGRDRFAGTRSRAQAARQDNAEDRSRTPGPTDTDRRDPWPARTHDAVESSQIRGRYGTGRPLRPAASAASLGIGTSSSRIALMIAGRRDRWQSGAQDIRSAPRREDAQRVLIGGRCYGFAADHNSGLAYQGVIGPAPVVSVTTESPPAASVATRNRAGAAARTIDDDVGRLRSRWTICRSCACCHRLRRSGRRGAGALGESSCCPAASPTSVRPSINSITKCSRPSSVLPPSARGRWMDARVARGCAAPGGTAEAWPRNPAHLTILIATSP